MNEGGTLSGSVFPVHGYILPHGKRNCKRFFAFFASLCKLYIDLQEGIKPFVQIAQIGRCCPCGEAVSEKPHTQGAGSFQDVNCLIFHNLLCLDKKFSKSNFQFWISEITLLITMPNLLFFYYNINKKICQILSQNLTNAKIFSIISLELRKKGVNT